MSIEGLWMQQLPLFTNEFNGKAEMTPAAEWDENIAKHALDELITLTFQYKASKSYHEFLQFVSRFGYYSPFNAMLIHIQMPGAKFVATAYRWRRDFGRIIKVGARPLVILQPMGPVMFVFDVSDTEPTEKAKPLPPEVDRPFEVKKGNIGNKLEKLIENAKRDGVRISESREGSQSAGSIRYVAEALKTTQKFQVGLDENKNPKFENIPVRYDLLVSRTMSREAKYATIAHELAHLYCGHLGTPNDRWWPDRRGLTYVTEEFEAESVSYLVCSRANIDIPSEQYIAGYVERECDIPPISLECVVKAAGLIEMMSRQKMKPRKKHPINKSD